MDDNTGTESCGAAPVENKLKPYLGSKIILAKPMDEHTFGREFKGTDPAEGEGLRTGYHVQYSNPDGSRYDAWSPTDVFERAYREVSADEKELINQ